MIASIRSKNSTTITHKTPTITVKSHKLRPWTINFNFYSKPKTIIIPTKYTGSKIISENNETYYIDKDHPWYVNNLEIKHISILNKHFLYNIGMVYKNIYFEVTNGATFKISKIKPNNRACLDLDDYVYMEYVTELLNMFGVDYEQEDLTLYIPLCGRLQIRPKIDAYSTKKVFNDIKIRVGKKHSKGLIKSLVEAFTSP